MVDVDGVVSWLVKLMQDAYVAFALSCSCEHGETELVFVDCLRTRKSKDDASRTNFGKCCCIKARIAL